MYQHEQYHKLISAAVKQNQTPAGGVYTHELMQATGKNREVITMWLKSNGYIKNGGHMSRYWVKI